MRRVDVCVLACGYDRERKKLGAHSQFRLDEALRVVIEAERYDDMFFFSAGRPPDRDNRCPPLCVLQREYVEALGHAATIPERHYAQSSDEELIWFKDNARPGSHRIVVSEKYHLPRLKLIAWRIGLRNVEFIGAGIPNEPVPKKLVVRERFLLLPAILPGSLQRRARASVLFLLSAFWM